jgi:hypothetical protein
MTREIEKILTCQVLTLTKKYRLSKQAPKSGKSKTREGLVPCKAEPFGPCAMQSGALWVLCHEKRSPLGLVPCKAEPFGPCAMQSGALWALCHAKRSPLGLVPCKAEPFGPCAMQSGALWALCHGKYWGPTQSNSIIFRKIY